MPAPYPPNSDVIFCTVLGCDWDYVEPTIDFPDSTLASVFGNGVMRAVSLTARAQTTERELEKHMATHTAVEFLKTISKLLHDRSEAIHLLNAAVTVLPPVVDSDTVLGRRITVFVDRIRAEGIGAVMTERSTAPLEPCLTWRYGDPANPPEPTSGVLKDPVTGERFTSEVKSEVPDALMWRADHDARIDWWQIDWWSFNALLREHHILHEVLS
jgi:hypothetical protein